MVSCGILISSQYKKIEEKNNVEKTNAALEAYRAGQQYGEQQIQKQTPQIQERVYESIPTEKPNQEKEFKFSSDSIVSTQNGISLSLDNFKYEIKGDDWGKITTIDLSVLNKGNSAFHPKVLVLLYDDKSLKEEWTTPKAEIKFDIWSLGVNEHVTKSATVNIPFHYLNLTKKFKLVLTDDFDYNNGALAVVEKDLNVT